MIKAINNVKRVRISYSFYKNFFSECKTEENSYRAKDKTIIVIIPDDGIKIPNTWKRDGQTFLTPTRVRITVYGSGACRSFLVEKNVTSVSAYQSKTIQPGAHSIKNLITVVNSFENN